MIGDDDLDGDAVRHAAAESGALLSELVDEPWDTPAPDLGMDVGQLVAHMAQCCFWYTVDLTAAGRPLEIVHPTVDATGSHGELVVALDVGAAVLAQSVDLAGPATRGFHPFGRPDRSGFAAMGCDEILIHTADVAGAVGRTWRPDAALAAEIVGRLFPWAPAGFDPWETLLWCNGRSPLGDRPRLQRWRWHCAPLHEWDGVVPSFVAGSTRPIGGTGPA